MTVTVTIIINKLYREDRYNKWNYIYISQLSHIDVAVSNIPRENSLSIRNDSGVLYVSGP